MSFIFFAFLWVCFPCKTVVFILVQIIDQIISAKKQQHRLISFKEINLKIQLLQECSTFIKKKVDLIDVPPG